MDSQSPQNNERTYYRWVSPSKWSAEIPDEPLASAFHRKEHEEGISVFDSTVATPDDVLEYQLTVWRRRGDEKTLNKFRNCAAGMREKGHHIVEIKASDFIRMGFTPDIAKIELSGHLNILGSQEDFETYAPALVKVCKSC